jgi:transposase
VKWQSVGLSLGRAIVVSIDEKTGVQAKQPIRKEIPLKPGEPARREFEYKRHGTVALLAALLVHTGEIKGSVYERNSRVEFLDFLELLEVEIPAGKQVHAILDNLQVHKTPEVCTWLEAHPRWQFHFTPTHASWLNQIELWFSILSRRLLKRGVFRSKNDLKASNAPSRTSTSSSGCSSATTAAPTSTSPSSPSAAASSASEGSNTHSDSSSNRIRC